MLTSFGRPIHAVVIGASGGIGAALADQLAVDPGVKLVTRFSRPALDLEDPASIAAAAASLSMPPDLVICATGLLHAAGARPERALKELEAGWLARNFAVNAIGPALVAQAFLPLMPREGRSVFAALSARVGSISDNGIGGWHGYRASKAALNQIMRGAAIELARTHKHAVCVALHPGTVATPFTAEYVGRHAVVAPQVAAGHLLGVIDGLGPVQSGGFYDWAGAEVPW